LANAGYTIKALVNTVHLHITSLIYLTQTN